MSSHVRKTDVDPEAVTVALHSQSHGAPLSPNNGREEKGCESYFSTVAIQHLLVAEEDCGVEGRTTKQVGLADVGEPCLGEWVK